MKKQIISISLVSALVFALASCGWTKNVKNTSAPTVNKVVETQSWASETMSGNTETTTSTWEVQK